MRTMSEQEIDQFIAQIPTEGGAVLSQIIYNEKVLQLHFDYQDKFFWITFSMKPGTPYLFFSDQRTFLAKNLKKPLWLFLKTHFVDRDLLGVERDRELGRVLSLRLSDGATIEISLVPGRVNVQASVGDKVVSAFKPKELAAHSSQDSESESKIRDPQFFLDLWQKQFDKKKAPNSDGARELKKEIKKKRSGLEKMKAKLLELEQDPWKSLGHILKSQQNMSDLPEEYLELIDTKETLAWNIERCFSQSKKNLAKIEGTQERIQVLQKEIIQLESGAQKKGQKEQRDNLLKIAEIKGRTVEVDGLRLFIGRSAKDNLNLLRKAKAWYLWLHIKDYPGAYGIVERNKNAKISEKALAQAALAVIKQSLPAGANGRYEAIYAECRYVRPIKGAKSGQVTYSHEKVISVQVK